MKHLLRWNITTKFIGIEQRGAFMPDLSGHSGRRCAIRQASYCAKEVLI